MIPQNAPKVIVDEDRAALNLAMARVLDSGFYILGPEVAAFETAFATYCDVRHAIGVANGTDALEIALRAVGVGSGDTVAVVSMTAVPTVAAIRRAGALPLFIDIDPDTGLMDLDDLERRTANKPLAAVVAVHLYGAMVAMDRLSVWCQTRGVRLVEDCAQAHGARFQGRRAGSLGNAGAFSFYPTKNLGAIGDAGMVVSDDAGEADRIRALRQYGWNAERLSEVEGLNSRMDPLQAALLGVLLRRLDARNARRREIAQRYDHALDGLPVAPLVVPAHVDPVYHQYVVKSPERDRLAQFLRDHGVATAIHYPVPVHRHPAYAAFADASLPVTEQFADQILSLPMFPGLENEEVDRIAALLKEFFA